jgi:CRISPR-associated RAMP protein (TIGR02581 family)
MAVTAYHDTFTRRVVLRGHLILLSGLHVGSGRSLAPSASDLPVMKDGSGRPFIPGSSLKGVVRSSVEAFLRGVQKPGMMLACYPVGGDAGTTGGPCISAGQMEEWRDKVRIGDRTWSDLDREVWEASCWTCRAFGSPWLAARFSFSDLTISSPWAPELLAVRDGVAIDRETETAASRLKFDLEVVPPGTRFRLEVVAENPQDHELGMLVLGMDMISEGLAFLGGQKSRGLGRVRIVTDEVVQWTPQAVLASLQKGRGLQQAAPTAQDQALVEQQLSEWRKALWEELEKALNGR